jgi:hypothetical protein
MVGYLRPAAMEPQSLTRWPVGFSLSCFMAIQLSQRMIHDPIFSEEIYFKK